MNDEPLMRIGDYEARPNNTSLFTFVGKTTIDGIEFENCRANHLFIQDEPGQVNGRALGIYFFLDNETSEMAAEIGAYMLENGYQCHINGQSVPRCDMEAYNSHTEQKVARELQNLDNELERLFGDGSTA